ncbi:MAG: ferrous iron transport protein B [Actinomycetota bacterium]|nr:ferrous iron transport protein B [Actinomycetota bacterium]
MDTTNNQKNFTIALIGNPNSGKTVVFNNLTGSRQHVGNWPGVTVEKKEGKLFYKKRQINIVDLPGIYSLDAHSEDERVARDYLVFSKPDVVINIIDSSNLERNLYLTTQLLEMGMNVVIALNMYDECNARKIKIDIKKLNDILKVPIVATTATKKIGMKELLSKTYEAAVNSDGSTGCSLDVKYNRELESGLDVMENMVKDYLPNEDGYPARWIALKLIEDELKMVRQLAKNLPEIIINKKKEIVDNIENSCGEDVYSLIAENRYDFIKKIITEIIIRDTKESPTSVSDKIDRVITNRFLGIPIFLIIMYCVFTLTFKLGDPIVGWIETFFGWLSEVISTGLANINAPELLTSLITEGIIGGLGSVLVFLPNILLLFLAISLLEDSGYMARAAYVIDRFMQVLGLHGKAFIPLLIGFGCNVPGVMATRTLENKKDRMTTILINPLMSCSARLPVYILFASAFFKGKQSLIVFSLYILGILLAIMMAFILKRFVFKGENSFFIMELPPYRVPTIKSTLIHMWERSSSFIKKAGTIIVIAVILIWALSNLPVGVEYASKDSLIGKIGTFVAPVFKPAGFGNWEAAVALVFGILAKEVVVGTLGVIYGVDEAGLVGAISQHWNPISAYSFMIMTLIYIPCIAVIGAIKRETNSWGWTLFAVGYSLVLGWVVSVLFYQIANLFVR